MRTIFFAALLALSCPAFAEKASRSHSHSIGSGVMLSVMIAIDSFIEAGELTRDAEEVDDAGGDSSRLKSRRERKILIGVAATACAIGFTGSSDKPSFAPALYFENDKPVTAIYYTYDF